MYLMLEMKFFSGNKNNFNNEESCNQVCNPTAVRAQSSSQSRCSLPKEIGPCKAAFSRFYFNTVTKKCESFTYGNELVISNTFMYN